MISAGLSRSWLAVPQVSRPVGCNLTPLPRPVNSSSSQGYSGSVPGLATCWDYLQVGGTAYGFCNFAIRVMQLNVPKLEPQSVTALFTRFRFDSCFFARGPSTLPPSLTTIVSLSNACM